MTYKAILEEDHKKVLVTWDDEARAAYIRFVVGKVASTKEISPGVIVDYSANGQILGVEILNPEEIKPAAFKAVFKKLKKGISFNPAAIPQLWPAVA